MSKRSKARSENEKSAKTDATEEAVDRRIPVADDSVDAESRVSPKRFSTRRIAEIYEDDGAKPDMSRIVRRDPHRRKKIFAVIIIILIIVLGAALAGLYFFNSSQNKFTGDRISLTVEGKTTAVSGDDQTITIKIHNGENISLDSGELTVLYPTNFHFASAEPTPESGKTNVWQLGTITGGDDATITLKGSVIGEVGSEKVFSFTYAYIPENFNSSFQESANFTITVGSSILGLEIGSPVRVGVGKESTFVITYRNDADRALEHVRVIATFPEAFSVISSDPEPREGTNTWDIDKLENGKDGKITIKGTLAGVGGETREFKVQAGLLETDNTFRLQVEKSALILLLKPELSITLKAGGSETGGIASLGGMIPYSLSYTNNGDVEVQDVNITATFASTAIDWDFIVDPQNGKMDGTSITWNKDQVSSLASVKPGEGSEISFSVPLLKSLNEQNLKKNLSVTTVAKAESKKVTDLEGQTFSTDSNTTVTKIATAFVFRAQARYYNDEFLQVGYGPIPPVVGQKTSYRIFWNLGNTSNEVTDVTVTATLAENVTWTGTTSVSAGEPMSYDAATRAVTWRINRIPVGAGILFPELEGYFDVSITPTTNDSGKVMMLVESAKASGGDSYTEQKINLNQELLTTQLDSDPNAKGKGIVAEADTQ